VVSGARAQVGPAHAAPRNPKQMNKQTVVGGEMIETSISRELAAGYPRFMAGCAQRGHPVEVFVQIEV